MLFRSEPLGALDALTRLEMQDLIEEVWRAQGFTAILVTHDVAEAPSWIGCSPRLLRASVDAVQKAGMACLTIRQALEAIGYSAAAPAGANAKALAPLASP